ncbi:MinD/ParA family ATP-binding protein [Actinomadura algeriensis]|uniref:MinD-like ATPase involved in chromosome partitioning or flagellar assembly n=1 Tax=Actinomadura algeriensis TaxID=1679523 RepID=A0ABR9JPP3_9ACTN|nr:AAA family ATPase [Actinomadura algeriensis]MBE1532537.1 MinD-like ATPase involved in chromosome partitioning or flagellar assembly [Actinomadura algeriensis]
MARNEHDGRSLEERLASLDAMNDDAAGRPSGSAAEPPGQRPDPAQQEPDDAGEQPSGQAPPPEPGGNPWLAAPPAVQEPPAAAAPQETQADRPVPPPPGFPGYGDPQQPAQQQPAQQQPVQQQPAQYDGGPMPQPFDGGMLPPPYPGASGYQGYDPSQLPPLDPAGQPQPYQPQQPWEIGPFPAQDPNVAASQPYQPVDPNTGQPYHSGPATPPPYPQVDPNTGQPYQPGPATPPPYPQVDPNTGRPYDPNAAASQPYQPVDPNTGQPYHPGAATPPPYPQVDPNTGRPYPQVDPNTGQPYAPIDPNTGQPMQGYVYPAGYPQQPQQPQEADPGDADSLSSENLLGERRIAPSSGWRRAVYKASGGNIHMGESQGDLRRKDLVARARTQVAGGHHRVAVMSLKGGVGKTTTTTGLGSMLGSLRGDTVIAVDANPDRGTLSDKVRLETAATVRDLLNSRESIHRYADVRAFTSQNQARLEILASDRDPAVSEAFSADDYAAAAAILEQFYSICITDCGTGLLHSAMAGVLSLADQLVLVSSPSVDGARSASATLDWLEAHDHGHLVRNGVVVLSMVRNRTRSQVDLDKLQAHFESRCRAVVRIPYDDHLEEGAEVELEQLAPPTREAYLTLAAVVGDGFAYRRPENDAQG